MSEQHTHHILPESTGFRIFALLIAMTVVTVITAHMHFGWFNLPLAMAIATFKAFLVCTYFMGLKWDHPENRVIFGTSFFFLAIFVVLTGSDLLFRKEGVYVPKGAALFGPTKGGPSKFKRPWNKSAELVAAGEGLFQTNCIACHGAKGAGDGPAAAALNPKPRNFTSGDGWKQGRSPAKVFATITKGFSTMPSFGTLPAEDRWALVHYLLSLGPDAAADAPADFAALGIDPNKDAEGGDKDKTLPTDFVIDRMSNGQ